MSWSEFSNKFYKMLEDEGIDPDYFPEDLLYKEDIRLNKNMKYYWHLEEKEFNKLKESGMLWELYPNCPEFFEQIAEKRDKAAEEVKDMMENFAAARKLKNKDLCDKVRTEVTNNISMASLEYALIEELIDRYEEII